MSTLKTTDIIYCKVIRVNRKLRFFFKLVQKNLKKKKMKQESFSLISY